MPENFLFESAGQISTITFNRPERRNCMNREVMLEFEQLVLRVRDDRTTRVLIVTGNGTAFSAGADLSGAKGIGDPVERSRIFAAHNRGLPRIIGRIFDTVLRLDCMTIGARTASQWAEDGLWPQRSISSWRQNAPSSGCLRWNWEFPSAAVQPK